MKKLLLKFADQVLSREELKAIRGASDAGCGTCYRVVDGISRKEDCSKHPVTSNCICGYEFGTCR